MERADVPLEQFEIQFNPEGLEDATKSKEALVTILRFLDKDILPEIEKFTGSVPQINEIENHPLRTAEDGRYALFVESQIRDFINNQMSQMERYLSKALQGLSEEDGKYASSLVMHKMDKAMEKLKDIARTASAKFDNFVEASQGHAPYQDEGNEVEAAINEAGENYRISVDKLLRRK